MVTQNSLCTCEEKHYLKKFKLICYYCQSKCLMTGFTPYFNSKLRLKKSLLIVLKIGASTFYVARKKWQFFTLKI